MKKLRFIFLLIFICAALFQVSAEQLTKVGIVDMARVITAFYSKSDAIRSLQEYWDKTEAELDRRARELSELEKKIESSKEGGDNSSSQNYERQAEAKRQERKDYYKSRLETYRQMYDNFGKTDDFFIKVQRAISAVAVRESFSVILKSDDPSIVYYSKDIDITEDVLEYISR